MNVISIIFEKFNYHVKIYRAHYYHTPSELPIRDAIQQSGPVVMIFPLMRFSKIGPFRLRFCEHCQATNLDFVELFTIDNTNCPGRRTSGRTSRSQCSAFWEVNGILKLHLSLCSLLHIMTIKVSITPRQKMNDKGLCAVLHITLAHNINT